MHCRLTALISYDKQAGLAEAEPGLWFALRLRAAVTQLSALLLNLAQPARPRLAFSLVQMQHFPAKTSVFII